MLLYNNSYNRCTDYTYAWISADLWEQFQESMTSRTLLDGMVKKVCICHVHQMTRCSTQQSKNQSSCPWCFNSRVQFSWLVGSVFPGVVETWKNVVRSHRSQWKCNIRQVWYFLIKTWEQQQASLFYSQIQSFWLHDFTHTNFVYSKWNLEPERCLKGKFC